MCQIKLNTTICGNKKNSGTPKAYRFGARQGKNLVVFLKKSEIKLPAPRVKVLLHKGCTPFLGFVPKRAYKRAKQSPYLCDFYLCRKSNTFAKHWF